MISCDFFFLKCLFLAYIASKQNFFSTIKAPILTTMGTRLAMDKLEMTVKDKKVGFTTPFVK